jgi:hypothetical protein
VHSGRSHKSKSLYVKVQKLSFYFFLVYATRMHSWLKENVCTVVLCFGHVGAMTTARDHGVFFGHVGS